MANREQPNGEDGTRRRGLLANTTKARRTIHDVVEECPRHRRLGNDAPYRLQLPGICE